MSVLGNMKALKKWLQSEDLIQLIWKRKSRAFISSHSECGPAHTYPRTGRLIADYFKQKIPAVVMLQSPGD